MVPSRTALSPISPLVRVAIALSLLCALGIYNVDPYYSVKYLHRDEAIENIELVADVLTTAFNPLRRIGLAALALSGGLLLIAGRRRLRLNGGLTLLWVGFVGWAATSLLWSDDPDLTVRRLMSLAAVVSGAAGAACWLSLVDIAWMIWSSGMLLIAGGFVSELALGTFTPWVEGYRFAGLLNPIGIGYSAGLVILSTGVLASGVLGWRRWALIGLCLVAAMVLVLTRSRGPTIASLGACLMYGVMVWTKRRLAIVAAVLITFGGLITFVATNQVEEALPGLVLLGRADEADHLTTLTGRVPLWDVALRFAAERPLLGYGFNSFWTPERFVSIAYETDFYVADLHNSYLNLLLGLGLPGLALGTGLIVCSAISAARFHRHTRDKFGGFACAVIVSHLVNGLLLSVFFTEEISSVLVVVVMIKFVFLRVPEEELGVKHLDLEVAGDSPDPGRPRRRPRLRSSNAREAI